MAEISAALVKELRELTGLGFMECKKALTETDGDLKKAEELLRIKSGAKASKAASRIAAEGVIGAFVSADGKIGALVELNSETDFVAKNEDFVAFAKALAELVATRNPKDPQELSSLELAGMKVEAKRQALVQKIGVLVDYEGPEEVGKDLAMHVAFAKPQHMTKAEVPADIVAREREIQLARAREQGKSAEIAAKMVEGSLNKFVGELTLMGQPFVKDDKQTVEKMLAARKAKVNGYAFFVVGEGIEKKATDFAAEVMAQAG